jgi:hypothetical protein
VRGVAWADGLDRLKEDPLFRHRYAHALFVQVPEEPVQVIADT